MKYLVSLQQTGMPLGFTYTFSGAERDVLLSAKLDEDIQLDDGTAMLDKYGDMNFSLRSPGGNQSSEVDYEELCWQLKNPGSVVLYALRPDK
ncbi:hypothetical protein [Massilia sp. CCM 8734]|uniref:hypothetical protein n=1 Tax=Massilia sp. CCM 8734 TaxID=2609283 RepID=UPI00141D987E|nr:hypothetical protein [Massilia sp. CCM 8734]NHZ94567.1 hypothetical protein [Massilia sp. CCM 8734]